MKYKLSEMIRWEWRKGKPVLQVLEVVFEKQGSTGQGICYDNWVDVPNFAAPKKPPEEAKNE